MNSYYIENIYTLDPNKKFEKKTNILIHEGKIRTEVSEIDVKPIHNLIKIQAQPSWFACPGFIDIGTRTGEPGGEVRETLESVAWTAVSAGYTSLFISPSSKTVNDSPYLSSYILQKTKTLNLCQFFLLASPTKNGLGEELSEIGLLIEAGVQGFYQDDTSISNSYLLKKILEYLKKFNVPFLSYCEDPFLSHNTAIHEGAYSNLLGLRGSPSAAEEIMVARDIALCRLTQTPVHFIKISTQNSLTLIRNAKKEGLPITASVSIAHLFLSEENLKNYDTNLKTNPPLRTLDDQKALHQALLDGTLDFVISDHNPLSALEKLTEFDHALAGMSTLDYTPSLLFEWHLKNKSSLMRFVEIMCTAPSQLLLNKDKNNLEDNLVIFCKDKLWDLQPSNFNSKSKNSAFSGKKLQGKALMTFVKGQLKYEYK